MKSFISSLPDHSPVEEGRLPGVGGVRELQAAAAGPPGRRPGDHADALPHAALRRHGARRLAGPLPALQGQPVADPQQPLRLGTGTLLHAKTACVLNLGIDGFQLSIWKELHRAASVG